MMSDRYIELDYRQAAEAYDDGYEITLLNGCDEEKASRELLENWFSDFTDAMNAYIRTTGTAPRYFIKL